MDNASLETVPAIAAAPSATPALEPVPPEGLLAVRVAGLAGDMPGGMILIARSDGRARRLAASLADLLPGRPVHWLPERDVVPGDRLQPAAGVLGQRAAVLVAVAKLGGDGPVVVLGARTALQAVPLPTALRDLNFELAVGQPLDEAVLQGWLERAGYTQDARVDEPGETALRGASFEIFPADGSPPLRGLTEAGSLSSLRTFDPLTQRSSDALDRTTLRPATELALDPPTLERLAGLAVERGAAPEAAAAALASPEGRRTARTLFPLLHPPAGLLDLLPEARVVLDAEVDERQAAYREEVAESLGSALPSRNGPGQALDLLTSAAQPGLTLAAEAYAATLDGRVALAFGPSEPAAAPPPATLRVLGQTVARLAATGRSVLVAVPEASAMAEVAAALKGRGLHSVVVAGFAEAAALAAGGVGLLCWRLAEGFEEGGMSVLPAPVARSRAAGAGRPMLAPADLEPGDVAVHRDHGVARVLGLETLAENDVAEDLLGLEFAQGKRLLVSASQLDRVWRYGSAEAGVSLDSLGGEAWATRRAVVEAEIALAAAALVKRAKRRLRAKAPTIAPSPERLRAVARRFGHEETPGQLAAIEATLADLAAGRPMDRLVVGDVGYGKTEVALRAVAATALAGFQVAMLAPTTVLAGQHLAGFTRRLAPFGLRVAGLTGQLKKAEADAVRAQLAAGEVDVAIGTHALLGSTVRFARLGLVVVDEEQRFGARHKVQLATLRSGRHALTLSATPIPRTLQLGLAGVRDLSVIDTPPVRRRPVRTRVTADEPATVAQTLAKERARGGQSFLVCPRVEGLEKVADEVRGLLPGAAVLVAHGKLRPAALDAVMLAFAGGEADVLVATSLIESGIDIPRANTMLVRRPDLFGLSQLHQLRGRVGRGGEQATCLLLTDPDHPLEATAARRLTALEAIESLGGGFAIAMLDLDQRGAGALTGDGQTGHVGKVGTELYQDLLAEALQAARGEPSTRLDPVLTLGVDGTLPESYLPEPALRLGLHRRLARTRTPEEVDELAAEIRDRFGPLPPEVATLLAVARLRSRCRRLNLSEVKAGPLAIALTFTGAGTAARAVGILDAPFGAGPQRLVVKHDGSEPADPLAALSALLDRLEAA